MKLFFSSPRTLQIAYRLFVGSSLTLLICRDPSKSFYGDAFGYRLYFISIDPSSSGRTNHDHGVDELGYPNMNFCRFLCPSLPLWAPFYPFLMESPFSMINLTSSDNLLGIDKLKFENLFVEEDDRNIFMTH